jgi:hypothetical protein
MGVHDTKLNRMIVEGHEFSEIAAHLHKITNINFQCKARPTALRTAVVHNNVKVVALLLQRGADMMITPWSEIGVECTLLMAFKQGESHEDLQFHLLRHLSDFSGDQFDGVALKNISRVPKYAMMYCSPDVFFAAEKMKTTMTVANPTGFTPLMFTIHQVGLYEEDVDNCAKIFDRVVEILEKDSTKIWQRYFCSSIHNMRPVTSYTGGTALGMLLFFVLAVRQKRCTEYAEYLAGVERGKGRLAQFMPATDPHYNGFVQFGIERDATQKRIHEKNLAIMHHLTHTVAPCIFAKMLPSMRVALGMATHIRLGNQQHDRGVGQLNADIMNMIFNQLVFGICAVSEDYKHMLY